jgi:hypothetical protein
MIMLEVIKGYRFEDVEMIHIRYKTDTINGQLTIDNYNDSNVLCVGFGSSHDISIIGKDFKYICTFINTLIKGKSYNEVITIIKSFTEK